MRLKPGTKVKVKPAIRFQTPWTDNQGVKTRKNLSFVDGHVQAVSTEQDMNIGAEVHMTLVKFTWMDKSKDPEEELVFTKWIPSSRLQER